MSMFRRKHDPLICALLRRLPLPGSYWSEADRKIWLGLLIGAFQMIYRDKPLAEVVDHERAGRG